MARRRSNEFRDLMEGFSTGWNLMEKYQDAQTEKAAGEAIKNTNQQETIAGGLTERPAPEGKVYDSDTGMYVDSVKPEIDARLADRAVSGLTYPASDTATGTPAGEGLRPQFDNTMKSRFTLDGKTQDKAFTEGEIDAARIRAAAKVYGEAGKAEKMMSLRKDASQMARDELSTRIQQEDYDRLKLQDKMLEGQARKGEYTDDSGMRVDIGQRVLDNQAAGMAGDQAALAAMKGLRQATLADQYVGAANVARAGGAKNQAQYLDLMSKGAAEVAKEAANDILNATSPADFNKGAFGKIDNGEDIAEVKNKDGTVSYNRVTKDGTVIAPINGGKPYKDFTEFKSELAMQVRGDPERFVGYLQKQADQQLERQKAADLKEYHAAQVKNGATSAAAAMKNANTSASLHKVEQETKQLALDTEKALGIDPDKRTPEQAALVKAFETKLVAKQNTPELQNAALGRLDGAVKDYLGLGKNSVTQLDPVELDRQKKVMLYSMEIGREAVAQNRRIDPAAVIKLAEDRYLRERAGAAAASTGVALPSAQAGGDFPRPWRNAK